jgi:hypothetical protein
MSYVAHRRSRQTKKRDVTHPWRSRWGCRPRIQKNAPSETPSDLAGPFLILQIAEPARLSLWRFFFPPEGGRGSGAELQKCYRRLAPEHSEVAL